MKYKCRKCGSEHEVYYVIHKDKTKHTVMRCGKNVIYIPKASNDLNLEIVPTKTQAKEQNQTRSLF
jgi:uncharacterized Zn finger protein